MHTPFITEAITEHWGERCLDNEPGCPVCDAWSEYDALVAAASDENSTAVSPE